MRDPNAETITNAELIAEMRKPNMQSRTEPAMSQGEREPTMNPDETADVSDIDINAPRSSMERLLMLAHSAIRQDLLLVAVSRRTQEFWQAHADTGPFEVAARNAGKQGWYVTDPHGNLLVERRLVAADYRGDHAADVIEAGR